MSHVGPVFVFLCTFIVVIGVIHVETLCSCCQEGRSVCYIWSLAPNLKLQQHKNAIQAGNSILALLDASQNIS